MILDVIDLLDNEEQAVELLTKGLTHDTDDTGDYVELITLSQMLKTAGKDTTWEPKTKTTKKCHRNGIIRVRKKKKVIKMILDVRDLLDNEEQAVELFTNGLIHDTGDDVELIITK